MNLSKWLVVDYLKVVLMVQWKMAQAFKWNHCFGPQPISSGCHSYARKTTSVPFNFPRFLDVFSDFSSWGYVKVCHVIGSMYGIFTYIYHKKSTIHVGKYCWWFRTPAPTSCLLENLMKNGIFSPSQLVIAGFHPLVEATRGRKHRSSRSCRRPEIEMEKKNGKRFGVRANFREGMLDEKTSFGVHHKNQPLHGKIGPLKIDR